MSKPDKKKKTTLDKVIMGAVIGGAIGSVLGASIAPKKGKETREEIREAVVVGKKRSKKSFAKIIEVFRRKKKVNKEDYKKIPHEDS
ncbi:YtxH domain-containing protein [Candidatus Gracilibacteria bacterium]|nr:YtxH domain-containing protein [Candidatus Gracilibacteria bacterium]